ncbi:Protein of unknown function [Clostridium cavendishii DSM 21758]|uniref:DUF2628 domain-containing protein n=1 Tax=Clostridium cavendishii DSM 21758 TaxID=1121302 RepID=A0A1M6NGF9_9CLOT|nr:DUF2628 domain-containing protein [Clostridium cavendishii]SHJ94769.1 Protein of unknown function [Clostridium cavendishii DSM 21758]
MEKSYKTKSSFTNEEYSLFVVENSKFYNEKFELFDNGKKLSWNWATFFLGGLWFIYRKLYAVGISLVLIGTLIDNLMSKHLSSPIYFFIWLAIDILITVFGNYIYYQHTNKKIVEVKNMGLSEEETKLKLSKVGGTSPILPIALIVIIFMIDIITFLYH